MKPESSLKVFVYGTLKPGEANFSAYCNGYVESQQKAYTKGILYTLPVGYPAMTEGDKKVQGVLLTFNDSDVLQALDRLEGYQPQRSSSLNEYYRRLVSVYDISDRIIGQAWAYFMTPAKVKQYQGTLIESNCWRNLTADFKKQI